jgi:hypothetical protein
MISIVHNEIQNAIEIHLDGKGIDLLMMRLEELKRNGDHVHIYGANDDTGVSLDSPYRENASFGELILNLLPSDAWK